MAGILDMLKGQQPDQPPPGGLLAGGGGQFSERLSDMFAGLAMGADPNQSLSRAGMMIAQGNQLRREKSQTTQRANQTAAWLQSQGLGEQEASYLATDPDALRAWYKEFKSGNQPEWEITDLFDDQGRKIKAMVDKKTGKYNQIGGAEDKSKTDAVEYGLNPVYGQDAQGNTVLGQVSKSGTFKPLDMPEGFKPSTGADKVDLGTQWGIIDRRTGQITQYIPKDLAGAESQKAQGDAQGKAIAAAPGDIQAGENALDLIDSIRNDPNREIGTGKTAILNNIPGTGAYDFQQKVEQAKSGAFLSAIQQMRGMGALSNAEGSAATAAVTRMNTSLTEEGFLEALKDYENIVRQGVARAQSKVQPASPPSAAAPQAPSQGGVVDYTDYFK